MIQRVQSIFLLLVALCMGLMLAFDIWQKNDVSNGEVVELDAFFLTHFKMQGVEDAAEIETGDAVPGDTEIVIPEQAEVVIEQKAAWYIAILAGIAAVVAIYSIFRYDNRLLQMKLAALNSLLIGGTLLACILLVNQGQEMLTTGSEGAYRTGLYMPAAALLFNMLANRFIRKDEALVRSSDRFR